MDGGLGIGFLLNLAFWIGTVSASVIVVAWAAAELFPGMVRKVRNRARGRQGRKRSSNPPEAVGQAAEERYRKAS